MSVFSKRRLQRHSVKYIEDYQDKHKGKEIWILGCGPSLDDYPLDFFKDKISIALNFAFLIFPNSTYFCSGHSQVLSKMAKDNRELLNRTISIINQIGYENHPRKLPPRAKFLGKLAQNLIWTTVNKKANKNPELFRALLRPTIENIIEKRICHYLSQRTIAHIAIFCAVILGAKKITLVGCEAAPRGKYWHAQKGGMRTFTGERTYMGIGYLEFGGTYNYRARAKFFPYGTKLLTQTLAEYGIEISKYFYATGYEKII